MAAVAMHGAGNLSWIAIIIAEHFFGYDGVAVSLACMSWIYGSAFILWAPGVRLGWTQPLGTPRESRRCSASAAGFLAATILAGIFAAGGSPLYLLAFLGLLLLLISRAVSLCVRHASTRARSK